MEKNAKAIDAVKHSSFSAWRYVGTNISRLLGEIELADLWFVKQQLLHSRSTVYLYFYLSIVSNIPSAKVNRFLSRIWLSECWQNWEIIQPLLCEDILQPRLCEDIIRPLLWEETSRGRVTICQTRSALLAALFKLKMCPLPASFSLFSSHQTTIYTQSETANFSWSWTRIVRV